MGPDGVVEVDPLRDDPVRLEAIGQLMQIDRLVFERPPQALDEDVVHALAPASLAAGAACIAEIRINCLQIVSILKEK